MEDITNPSSLDDLNLREIKLEKRFKKYMQS